ncbi:hypothetical protein KTC97_20390 (plasmid) [Clostridium estertheticum]|nr:hypothetical protein [Clostridium estertheticum]WLC86499.1 hypothetical protein KTC97_20390 [Clostridium estertheticum]
MHILPSGFNKIRHVLEGSRGTRHRSIIRFNISELCGYYPKC